MHTYTYNLTIIIKIVNLRKIKNLTIIIFLTIYLDYLDIFQIASFQSLIITDNNNC